MSWQNRDSGAPVYLQIMDDVRRRIVSGEWAPGQRTPAVRELAIEFGVNPNTMQRALFELEREELLYSERTAGRFVTEDAGVISAVRDRMAREAAETFMRHMDGIGYSLPQIIDSIKTAENEKPIDNTNFK